MTSPSPGPAAPGPATVTAPVAPGQLGRAVPPADLATYLAALGRWREARRTELERLDGLALSAAPDAATTADLTLALALWQAVSTRYDRLLAAWDNGRVGSAERMSLSSLIWGRLDPPTAAAGPGGSAPPTTLAVSVPEACRLSDALAAQLRVRLGLDPSGAETTERVRRLRAQLERIRDQVGLEPPGAAQLAAADHQARLARRLKELVEKAARGGDVSGLLGPLDIDAATFERDLIVANARRRESAALLGRARAERATLQTREAALRLLVDRCVATVDPAPHYAVPEVERLGPVPNTRDRLAAYLTRLAQVGRALSVAERAYGDALAEYDGLRLRLEAYAATIAQTGLGSDPGVIGALDAARAALDRRPCPLVLARRLVELPMLHLDVALRAVGPGDRRDPGGRP
ncbi:MAG: hypothetical protein JWP61_2053 [Friedmanniella sp.]|nr:hypothetical protein [Friedmanniella sp.]